MIAVHEASHAVVTRSIGQTVSAQKLSIVARGRQLGTAAHMLTDRDQVIMQEPDLRRQLVSIVAGVGGRAAPVRLPLDRRPRRPPRRDAARAPDGHVVRHVGRSSGRSRSARRRARCSSARRFRSSARSGQSTLELIDREVERLVGEALETRDGGARAQLARGRGDARGAARARDAVGRRARRGAVDGAARCRSRSPSGSGVPRRGSRTNPPE